MQPSHLASDVGYVDARIGPMRVAGAYAWKSVLAGGQLRLPFGSDFPTAGSIPPLLGFHAAVTRETPAGTPAGGWRSQERVTAERALLGYTAAPAYASFREGDLGTLDLFSRADLTILDTDILTCDRDHILSTRVLGTIVGGRLVYAANSTAAPTVESFSKSKSNANSKDVTPGAQPFTSTPCTHAASEDVRRGAPTAAAAAVAPAAVAHAAAVSAAKSKSSGVERQQVHPAARALATLVHAGQSNFHPARGSTGETALSRALKRLAMAGEWA